MDIHVVPHARVNLVVALGGSDRHGGTQTRVRDQHVVKNVVHVSDPDNLLALNGFKGRDSAGNVLEDRRVGTFSRNVWKLIVGVVHLVDSQEVGEDLGWVPKGRKGVDDGHWRMFDEGLRSALTAQSTYLNLRMVSYTCHEAINHATNDLGGILETFIDAELNILAAQEHWMTTENLSTCFARYACTGATLVEKQGDSLAS